MPEPALNYNLNMVHVIHADFTYADHGKQKTVGVVPARSLIFKNISGVDVETAFNDSGSDLLDIGVSANDDLYATDLSLASAGWQSLDEAITQRVGADDLTFTATYTGENANASAGAAKVVICFIPPDPAVRDS